MNNEPFDVLGLSEQLKWIQSKLLRTADDRESTGKLTFIIFNFFLCISLHGVAKIGTWTWQFGFVRCHCSKHFHFLPDLICLRTQFNTVFHTPLPFIRENFIEL